MSCHLCRMLGSDDTRNQTSDKLTFEPQDSAHNEEHEGHKEKGLCN